MIVSHNGREYFTGLKLDRAASNRITASLAKPTAKEAAPHLAGTGEGKDVFFWEAEEKVLGRILPSWDQSSIGSCVSHGTGRSVQDLLLIEIVLGQAEEWPGYEVSREAIYGGSRCEVGGWWNDYSDGSIGAYAAKWISQWGILLAKNYTEVGIDLTGYDVQRCKQYGAKGVPDKLEPIAKEHPVEVTLVKTVEQARDLLVNGYPINICGTLGRSMKRQPGGWCRVEGGWNHSQELRGACVVKGNKPAIVYQNSWGDYLGDTNNRVTLESGREIVLPQGCYLSDYESIQRELNQEDTFAHSNAKGWPKQNLSWYL